MPWRIISSSLSAGAPARPRVTVWARSDCALVPPLVTMSINIAGSMVMGLIVGYFAFAGHASQHWRLFLTTGLLGGFTTFSTFSLDAVLLDERGEAPGACAYVFASTIGALGAALAGLAIMRAIF